MASWDATDEAVVAAFLDDLALQGRADRTIGQYRDELRRYRAWLEEADLHWRTITPRELANYARTRARLSFSSRAALRTALRGFYLWAVASGELAESPATGPAFAKATRPKPAPRALSAEQTRTLVTYLVEHMGDGLRQQRDAVLLLTALYTGLRAAELAALSWSDVGDGALVVRKGKGQRGRAVKLRADVAALLVAWRVAQGGTPSGWVFGLDTEKVCPNRVGKVARYYAQLLGLPLTAHVLRHTFATHANRRSGDVWSVSQALGHASVAHTQTYLRLTAIEDTVRAVDSLPGLSEW